MRGLPAGIRVDYILGKGGLNQLPENTRREWQTIVRFLRGHAGGSATSELLMYVRGGQRRAPMRLELGGRVSCVVSARKRLVAVGW